MKIIHTETGELLAEGKRGWAITPFEGNFYVSRKCIKSRGFRTTFLPGLCPYKFLYVWQDFHASDGTIENRLGWMYWLPNPLLPFIWFRTAIPGNHPSIRIIEDEHAGP